MKIRTKIILFLAGSLLLFGIGSFQFTNSMTHSGYGNLMFSKDIRIAKISVSKNGQVIRTGQISEVGDQLDIKIKSEEIDIPWTFYIPFYQSGSISAHLVYDAQVVDKHWKSMTVFYSQTTNRYGIIPDFSIRNKITTELEAVLFKATELRVEEAQRKQ